jgi:transposase
MNKGSPSPLARHTMPQKKYIVTLTSEERQQLEQISRTGKASAYQITRARILLKADTSQPEENWKDAEISAALDVSVATIERLREQFVEEGVPKCLQRKTRMYERLLDGEQEAKLVAIACSEAPAGRSRWTLRLLSERVVELGYVEQISYETVRQTLKKMNSSLGAKTAG